MDKATPFFPGFHRLLFGRARRSAQAQLADQARALEKATLCQLGQVCAPWVPARLLQPAPRGAHSRRRFFPQGLTFWAFLSQVLSPESPCRETVRKVQAWYAVRRQPRPGSGTAAYCRARSRLRLDTLLGIHRHTAHELQRRVTQEQLWCGRRVKVVDGTGVSMPDTPQNQKAFPQPSNQKKGCGFPVAKIVGCFCLASGALLHWAEGNKHVHESKLFRKLFDLLRPDDVILTDRGFCSYAAIATLRRAGIDTVMRLHQARPRDLRKGRRLGANDRLVTWVKPKSRPRGCLAADWRRVPATLTLRLVHVPFQAPGFRAQPLVVVTTLTDPIRYPAQEIARLYLRRWAVELFFRDIKIALGMDVLRCQTPAMVRKEIAMHAIAYNLVRGLMQQAAALYHVPLERISFKGSVDTLRQWADAINATHAQPRQQTRLFNHLLQILAENNVPLRPDRSEPRVRKRRPKAFPLMTRPRRDYRLATASKKGYFFLPASFFCLTVHIGYAIYTRMHTKASSDAEALTRWRQDVARLWPVAKGSLSEVRKPCTRSNCPACRDGRRHRVFLFCYREDGRGRCAYVPAAEVARVRQAIANGRELERRIVAAGRELIAGRQRQEGHART